MPYSLYLHIPFCAHRCAYCDFNTYAGQEDSIPAYVRALCAEIEAVGQAAALTGNQIEIHTVFFGGGTPSLLNPYQFGAILSTIRNQFDLRPSTEITIEANPGTVSQRTLGQLRNIGINRISFGVQSANTEELRMLERAHSFYDVISAVQWAREAGFDNLNLDLIYGLPEQRLATWQSTLERAIELSPQHLSLYALTLEHGTPFGRWSAKGLLPLPDPDLAAEMYEWASAYLSRFGYIQYEISNWAKTLPGIVSFEDEPPFYACSHNLQYWRSLPYLGLGAGAHGYVAGARYSNVLRIKTYIERLTDQGFSSPHGSWPTTSAAVNLHRNTPRENMSEMMITGLRLTREGVSTTDFHDRFGLPLLDVFGKEIKKLESAGLLEWAANSSPPEPIQKNTGDQPDRLRLTAWARLVANQVFIQFVD